MQIETNAVGDADLRIFDAGYMTVQIGANESQTLNMNFPEVSCLNLGLRSSDGNDKINLCTQYSSENALNSMDRAIKRYPEPDRHLVLIRIVWRQRLPVWTSAARILQRQCHGSAIRIWQMR